MNDELDKTLEHLIVPIYKDNRGTNSFSNPVILVAGDENRIQGAVLVKAQDADTSQEIIMNDEALRLACETIGAKIVHGGFAKSVPFIITIGEFIKSEKTYIALEQSNWKSERTNHLLEITKNESNIPVLRRIEDGESILSDSIVRKTGGLFWNSYIQHQLEG